MGRRKIEIKAIKDDRNRSVTFLKRKGGLFKKAYELGVLCSVDVAVVIVGPNNRIYEFSSTKMGKILSNYNAALARKDLNIYERRGPKDFSGRDGIDDEEDSLDAAGTPSDHAGSPEPQVIATTMALPQMGSATAATFAHQHPHQNPHQQQQHQQQHHQQHQHQHQHQQQHPQHPLYNAMSHHPMSSPALDGNFADQMSQHGRQGSHTLDRQLPPPQPYGYQPQSSSLLQTSSTATAGAGVSGSMSLPPASAAPSTTMPPLPSIPTFQYTSSSSARAPQTSSSQEQSSASPNMTAPVVSRQSYMPPPPQHFNGDMHAPPPPPPPFHPPPENRSPYRSASNSSNASTGPSLSLKTKTKSLSTARNSIFTPIDDRRSLLAQHWKNNVAKAQSKADKDGSGSKPLGSGSGSGSGSTQNNNDENSNPHSLNTTSASNNSSSNNSYIQQTLSAGPHHFSDKQLKPMGLSRNYPANTTSQNDSLPFRFGNLAAPGSPRRTNLTLNRDQLLNGPIVSPGPLTHMSESSYFHNRSGHMPPSMLGGGGADGRPRLKLEIPSEESDSESESRSAHPGNRGLTRAALDGHKGDAAGGSNNESSDGRGTHPIQLPPLSPSGSNMSDCRSRQSGTSVNYRNGGDETPMSVLGGRFFFEKVLDQPETPFRGNMLPSPIGMSTPGGFKSILGETEFGRKRRGSDAAGPGTGGGENDGPSKKIRA